MGKRRPNRGFPLHLGTEGKCEQITRVFLDFGGIGPRWRRGLPKPQSRITQQMIDDQKLWERSRLCIGSLAGQDGVAQSLVLLVHHLIEYSFVTWTF